MLRRSRLALAATVLSITTVALAAQAAALQSIDKADVKIEAEAKPGLGKFDGLCDAVSAKEEGGKLVFEAELNRGLRMGLRDKHTREAFNVPKHKVAKLVVDKSEIKFPDDKGKVSGKVKGDLTLHGKTKPVTVNYVASRTGSDIHIKDASFSFDYTQFGVEKICKLGVCVEPTVTIRVPRMKLREK
jgi:polyisoprenoid-binding protein YceI